MVLDSLFLVVDFQASANEINALLSLNSSHAIFQGHFPGQPVVPGVCMMQMMKELVERHLEKKLTLTEGDNMKFLSVLDPTVTNRVRATVNLNEDKDRIVINGSLFADSVTFFKLKAVLHPSI